MNEAGELLKSIRPLNWILNPFFYVTFYLRKEGFSVSKCGIILGFCSLLLSIAYKVSFIFWDPAEDFEDHIENYATLLPLFLCCLSFISYVINRKAVVNALNEIVNTTTLIGSDHFYRNIFRVVLIQVFFSYTFPFIFTGSVICKAYMSDFYGYKEIEVLDYIATTCFGFFILMHFSATCITFGNSILFCQKIILKLNKQLQCCKGVYQITDASSESFVKMASSISYTSPVESDDNLLPLITIYDMICQLCQDFCDLFGFPLSASFIFALINIVLNSYFVTKYGVEKLWMNLFHFLHCVMLIWFVLYACEKFTQEMRKTGLIVSRLLIGRKNEKQKKLLQQFSILLLHRKVKFTAHGLVALNYKLIYSTIATVAAYVAITYQFDSASTFHFNQRGNKTAFN